MSDDLPAPTRPTTATSSPGRTENSGTRSWKPEASFSWVSTACEGRRGARIGGQAGR